MREIICPEKYLDLSRMMVGSGYYIEELRDVYAYCSVFLED
jgi:hypothetical protein